MSGFIKLDRCLLQKHIFSNEKLFKIWIWCLLRANHSPGEVLVGMQPIKIQPGQFMTGRHKAAEELGMKPSTVWKHLKWLEKNQSIVINSNNKYSVITVVNWEFYQLKKHKGNNKMTTKEQQKDTNKNVKEKDIVESPKNSPKEVIDYYHDAFVKKFGTKPIISGGKDGALMKKVVTAYGLDKTKELLNRYFESKDEFVVTSGYTIAVFYSQINKLIAQSKPRTGLGDL